jgi:hypothetical protein
MSNVAGTWTLTTDFGCDGSIAGSFDQTFNADGTWTNTIGSNGRWYQVEGLVVSSWWADWAILIGAKNRC